MSIQKAFVLLAALLSFSLQTFSEDTRIRVLSIGNSYSEQSCAKTPAIADSMGIKLKYASAHIGGSSMSGVLNALEHCKKKPGPRFGLIVWETLPLKQICRNAPCDLWKTLKEDQWDKVVIMYYRKELLDHDKALETGRKMIALIREAAPQAQIYLHGIWTPRVDDPVYAETKMTQEQLTTLFEVQQAKLATELGIELIPVGTGVKICRAGIKDKFKAPTAAELAKFQYPKLPGCKGDIVGGYGWKKSKADYAFGSDEFHKNNGERSAHKTAGYTLSIDSVHLNTGVYLQGLLFNAVLFGVDPEKVTLASGWNDGSTETMRACAKAALTKPLAEVPVMTPEFKPAGSGRVTPDVTCSDYRNGTENLLRVQMKVGSKSLDIQRRGTWIERNSNTYNRIYINNGEKLVAILYLLDAIPAGDRKLACDPKKGVVTFSQPYQDASGNQQTFSFRLESLPDSKVKVSWENAPDNRKCVFRFPQDSSLATDGIGMNGKEITYGVHRINGGFVSLCPRDAGREIKIEIGDNAGVLSYNARTDAKTGKKSVYAELALKAKKSGSFLFDLGIGDVSAKKKTPAPVGGIDFWKEDMLELASSATRNQLENPSFEQGFRYWTWSTDGKFLRVGHQSGVFEIVSDALFGKKALRIHARINPADRLPSIVGFPRQLNKGKKYTISCYAKAVGKPSATLEFRVGKASQGSTLPLPVQTGKCGVFQVGADWTRCEYTFTADQFAARTMIHSNDDVVIDGIQLEEGEKATEFIAPPLDGNFVTADPRNDITYGQPVNAAMEFVGKPGTSGKVNVTITNFFREIVAKRTLNVSIGADGTARLPLTVPDWYFGTGIYLIRAEYEIPGMKPYTDFFRLSIMRKLDNRHPTCTLPGTLLQDLVRMTEQEAGFNKFREWGVGSTSWVLPAAKDGKDRPDWQKRCPWIDNTTRQHRLMKQNRITCMQTAIWDYIVREVNLPGHEEDRQLFLAGKKSMRFFTGRKINAECEKIIEDQTYKMLKECDPSTVRTISWGNEEESSELPASGQFDEYAKYQLAVARGAIRAGFKTSPTSGTAGYSRIRGADATKGFMRAAHKAGFHYDSLSTHPYGNIDGGVLGANMDMDDCCADLVNLMKETGHEKAEIYFNECGNNPQVQVTQWTTENGDLYTSGMPTYAWGNMDFLIASSYLRKWIICLKYWPTVKSTNIWVHKLYMDMNFTPVFLAKAMNTFGNMLPDVEFQADVRPAPGVRSYVFKVKPEMTGTAAIWFVSKPLELSREDCPRLSVKFSQPVKFYDMMENERTVIPDEDGFCKFALTPAPLFIKAKDAKLLAEDLAKAELASFGNPTDLSFRPNDKGGVDAVLKNRLTRPVSGTLQIGNENIPINLGSLEEKAYSIRSITPSLEFGRIYRNKIEWNLKVEKVSTKGTWNMDHFFVQYAKDEPDWSRIPAIPVTNVHKRSWEKQPSPEDFSATMQLAWNERNLYLRVTAKDREFRTYPVFWESSMAHTVLYRHDGCLEVYFDCGADGRQNPLDGYNKNDYRYDFSIGRTCQSGPGCVYRLVSVDHQLADGINMPSLKEASEKIKCDFQITKDGYVYTIVFAQRYIEPLTLRHGFPAGFCIYLHDKDNPDPDQCNKGAKGLTISATPGVHCQFRPFDWPLMLLIK